MISKQCHDAISCILLTAPHCILPGFGSNKRIVLYDTLINQSTEEEVVAVLAHELGHWKLRHTPVMFAMGQVSNAASACISHCHVP